MHPAQYPLEWLDEAAAYCVLLICDVQSVGIASLMTACVSKC